MPLWHEVRTSGQCTGDNRHPGLQAGTGNWTTSGHDITCDIVDLPANTADVILCSEVLEHVPDPLAALKSIIQIVTQLVTTNLPRQMKNE